MGGEFTMSLDETTVFLKSTNKTTPEDNTGNDTIILVGGVVGGLVLTTIIVVIVIVISWKWVNNSRKATDKKNCAEYTPPSVNTLGEEAMYVTVADYEVEKPNKEKKHCENTITENNNHAPSTLIINVENTNCGALNNTVNNKHTNNAELQQHSASNSVSNMSSDNGNTISECSTIQLSTQDCANTSDIEFDGSEIVHPKYDQSDRVAATQSTDSRQMINNKAVNICISDESLGISHEDSSVYNENPYFVLEENYSDYCLVNNIASIAYHDLNCTEDDYGYSHMPGIKEGSYQMGYRNDYRHLPIEKADTLECDGYSQLRGFHGRHQSQYTDSGYSHTIDTGVVADSYGYAQCPQIPEKEQQTVSRLYSDV